MFESQSMQKDWNRIQDKREMEDFKKQAFEDANQWKLITNDETGGLVFMSKRTGELRSGSTGAANWVVQDDGYGFPCFYNVFTEEMVFEDPRFFIDPNEDSDGVKTFVMQELRFAVYFCQDFWERYEKAVADNDSHQQRSLLMKFLHSSKPKQLTSFLIRAKALYQVVSVIDQPMNVDIYKELDYASWLAARMADMLALAEAMMKDRKQERKVAKEQMMNKAKEQLFCSNCKRETKRHLEFCPHCGKKQFFF